MFSISLNRVHDRITIREGNDKLYLNVDSDPRVVIAKIRSAQELLQNANRVDSLEEKERAARAFSDAIFGEEQTGRLAEFYGGDYSCVMTICGLYFERRLRHKIAKAQKKVK